MMPPPSQAAAYDSQVSFGACFLELSETLFHNAGGAAAPTAHSAQVSRPYGMPDRHRVIGTAAQQLRAWMGGWNMCQLAQPVADVLQVCVQL